MKKFALLNAIYFAGFFLLAACNNSSNSKQATTEELSQMNRDFAKALNNKDAAAAANCYTDDATVLPPNQAPVTGRAAIKKYWEGAVASGAFDVDVATI